MKYPGAEGDLPPPTTMSSSSYREAASRGTLNGTGNAANGTGNDTNASYVGDGTSYRIVVSENARNVPGQSYHHHPQHHQQQQHQGNPNQGEEDFSEYMWMEHEDTFNEQVMRELQEEEMMLYCFEAYQESLEAEAAERSGHLPNASSHNGSPSSGQSNDSRQGSTVTSTLNPYAAEFVPRQRYTESQEAPSS